MDGFLFFLVSWSTWIYVTFIMSKTNRLRLPIAFSMLMLIILVNYYFEFFNLEFSLASLFILILGYCFFINRKTKEIVSCGFYTLIITLAGVIFKIMALIDPVWIITDLSILQGLIFTFIALFLFKSYALRILATSIGLVQADFIFGILLKNYGITYPIGSLDFWDRLAVTHLFITFWYFFEFLQFTFQKNTRVEKEKQF